MTTGNVSVSVLAGHLTVAPTPPNEQIGQQVSMGDDLYFHITADVARQWIGVLETIADQAPKRYVIVDKMSGAIDWDCELHPTHQAAIDSMCNIRQMYVRTPDQANEDKVYWADHYEICEVRTINEEKSE